MNLPAPPPPPPKAAPPMPPPPPSESEATQINEKQPLAGINALWEGLDSGQRNGFIAVASLIFFPLIFAGLSGANNKTIRGTFTLVDSGVEKIGSYCSGTGGYSDIEAGLKVKVTNEKGTILAISELGDNNWDGEYSSIKCVFPFVVKNVPNAKFYSIEVGRRGSLEYSRKELEKRNWRVDFKLG